MVILLAGTLVPLTGTSAAADGQDQNVFGVNMSLYDSGDQVMTDPATQQLLRSWRVPYVRVPMRQNLDGATLIKALRAVRAIGAVPVAIISGPGELSDDGAILARDRYDLGLMERVFPHSPVYLEYGNEDDLAHGIDASAYTASWNTVVSQLKATAPASYHWAGPVNYQTNPSYIAAFVAGASPRPDFVSWHEYVCQASDTSTCDSHIANWMTHARNTNAAEQNAIGTTIPFLITEWNVDPSDSSADQALYGDPGFIQPWTQDALAELRSLTSVGLAGALIYTTSDHGDFALLSSGPTLTPQGQTFADEATAGTTHAVDFEDGTDGWLAFWGSITPGGHHQ